MRETIGVTIGTARILHEAPDKRVGWNRLEQIATELEQMAKVAIGISPKEQR